MTNLLKKHNFYLVEGLSLISLELQKANKNLRKFPWQWQTNNIFFKGVPYWETNQIRIGGRISIWCSPKIIHNIHRNQANNNSIEKSLSPFQGNRGKVLSFKSSTTKQNFLELIVLQCQQSAFKGPVSTNQISETYYCVSLRKK